MARSHLSHTSSGLRAPSGAEISARVETLPKAVRQDAWVYALAVWVRSVEEAKLLGLAAADRVLSASVGDVGRTVALSPRAARETAEALQQSGVLRKGRGLCISDAVLAPRLGADLDWSAVLRVISGNPAALAVCWAHASVPGACLGEWFELPLPEAVEQSRFRETAVRKARAILVDARLLEIARVEGRAARFRFTEAALGRNAAPAEEQGTRAASAPLVTRPASPPTTNAGVAVRVVLNGMTLEVPAGYRVTMQLGADGVPNLVISPTPDERAL